MKLLFLSVILVLIFTLCKNTASNISNYTSMESIDFNRNINESISHETRNTYNNISDVTLTQFMEHIDATEKKYTSFFHMNLIIA